MGINEIIMYIMMFFMLIAAVDRILSQFGGSARFLGKFGKSIEGSGGQFEEGFMAMGALGLAMVGMTALAPVLAHVLGPVIIPVYEMLGANPSMFAGTLLACDMGGFFLAKELAGGDVAAWLYSGLILGSMMGPTIVFSIPVALGIIEPSDRRYLALGVLAGIVTIPIGCIAGGLVAMYSGVQINGQPVEFTFALILMNMIPVIIVAILVALGLKFIPEKMINGFQIFAKFLVALITLGLAAAVVKFLLGWELIPGLDPIFMAPGDKPGEVMRAIEVISSISCVLLGAYPMVLLLTRWFEKPLMSVGIDIGTTTTQVIFSHLELVNRAAVSQVPRYEFIKREISWQSPVFFTPVDKQGGLKEAELKSLILEQYQAAGIAPESVDSGAIIITGESAKTRNARPAVMALSQSLGDFVVASAGPHLESVIAGHGAGAQTLSEQRLCRVLNIDIGGGTANYALFDAGKISGTACLNVGGRLLETDSQGRVVYAHKPGQMIVDECFGAGTDARSLTGAQLVQVTRRMAALIVEVIDGTLSPLAQALMQTGLLPAGVTPEIITLSGGVGECYRHQPADPFCFADIGPLLATALHDHPRLREMNVQFPAQTVRATVIGAGAHTLSLSGSTIWLEGVQLPLRNLPVAIPIDETDLVSAWQQALLQLDLDPKTDAYVLALPASLPVRYAAVLTVINALVDFVARFPNPHPLLVVAGQDFGKALGMLLRPQLQQLPLAVIDEVIVRAGDYIDIGTPLFGGSVVPVTVKSLAFPS
ncbi:TPA: ethanolamine ammonia-lyase reactivating factor EutA [Escherichia coli]|nr:ethanolamine ammonia-lyase reactivating factor EutA [Escherichia coli]HCP1556955.1 ethanolamine ammonia-lyase reactivating factor EutA [Escherichia coli]HCP1649502.1 ethanolamine ammonia-lyase reactivating factor EutA [Escherichia coli]